MSRKARRRIAAGTARAQHHVIPGPSNRKITGPRRGALINALVRETPTPELRDALRQELAGEGTAQSKQLLAELEQRWSDDGGRD